MTKTGAWTGHAVVEARDSVLVPDGVSAEEAGTVVVNGVTAWQMLHRVFDNIGGKTTQIAFGLPAWVAGW